MYALQSTQPSLTVDPRTSSSGAGRTAERRPTNNGRGEIAALLIMAVVVSLPMLILAVVTTVLEGVLWPIGLAVILVLSVAGLILWSDRQIRRDRQRRLG